MAEVAPLVRRQIDIDPEASYTEIGVKSFYRGIFQRRIVSGSEFTWQKLFRIHEGDLVFSNLMAWEQAIGIAAPSDHGSVGNFKSVDQSHAYSKYAAWFCRLPHVWDILKAGATGMGDRRRTLRPQQLLDLEIPLPPLNTQRRIVAQLDGVASQLAARQAAAAAVEDELAAMLRVAFDRIIANVPRARMAEVAPLVRRQVAIDPEASYTEIGVKSFYRGIFHRRTLNGSEFTWQKLFRLHEGDLVFSNLMAWEQAIGVAAPNDHGTVGNHRMLTCEPIRTVCNPNFLW